MAAATSLPLPSPVLVARNLRVVQALAEAPPEKARELTREEAYDLLAKTSIGNDAATLHFKAIFGAPERMILGRFVAFSAPRRRAIKGKGGRTAEILIPTKSGGVEVLGEGASWSEAWANASRRIASAS